MLCIFKHLKVLQGLYTSKSIFLEKHRPTRPKKIAEGGVCTLTRADDVPRSVIHSCSRKAFFRIEILVGHLVAILYLILFLTYSTDKKDASGM